jgi:hypothetical protein
MTKQNFIENPVTTSSSLVHHRLSGRPHEFPYGALLR